MGVFNSQKTIETQLQDVKPVLADVKAHFEEKGFEVQTEETIDGGLISITKGGIFKDVMGLKSALNTTLTLKTGSVFIDAKIGAFGGKAIAAVGAWLVAWPLAVTAAVGMITQSKLDDEMIAEIEKAIYKYASNTSSDQPTRRSMGSFCTNCGAAIPENASFCPGCGGKL